MESTDSQHSMACTGAKPSRDQAMRPSLRAGYHRVAHPNPGNPKERPRTRTSAQQTRPGFRDPVIALVFALLGMTSAGASVRKSLLQKPGPLVVPGSFPSPPMQPGPPPGGQGGGPPPSPPPIPDLEARTLIQLAAMWGWKFPGSSTWKLSNPCALWAGVTCSHSAGTFSVVSLTLQDASLSGPLPSIVSNLVHLTSLTLSSTLPPTFPPTLLIPSRSNSLSGAIPPSIGQLRRLVELQLAFNSFTGGLPASLCNLTALRTLDLRFNSLNGTLPGRFPGCLKSLVALNLRGNFLQGRLPWNVGGLQKAQFLDLTGNRLSGPIPESLGNATALTALFLPQDVSFPGVGLSGKVPGSFSRLQRLQVLNMQSNQLSGGIPSELASLSSLETLNLGFNGFSGGIPRQFWGLTSLQTLNLESNSISGPIHSSIGNLVHLQYLDLSGNQFSGQLPLTFGLLTNLGRVSMANNSLGGKLPWTLRLLGSLVTLDLSFNIFSGPILPGIINLPRLSVARFDSNHFSGRLPPIKTQASLNVSSNFLTGKFCQNDTTASMTSVISDSNCFSTCASQRRRAQCTRFCNSTAPPGPCNGKGVCSWGGRAVGFSCSCQPGFAPTATKPSSCTAL